jgi:hypothetical protein
MVSTLRGSARDAVFHLQGLLQEPQQRGHQFLACRRLRAVAQTAALDRAPLISQSHTQRGQVLFDRWRGRLPLQVADESGDVNLQVGATGSVLAGGHEGKVGNEPIAPQFPGRGLAFVGQVPLTADEEAFHLDLLFYPVRLHCYFVADVPK